MKFYKLSYLGLFFLFLMTTKAYSQVQESYTKPIAFVRGAVYNSKEKNPIKNANVVLKGSKYGVTTNENGYFEIIIDNMDFPFTISIGHVGYKTHSFVVEKDPQPEVFIFYLEETVFGIDEVVIGASRFEESLIESPITVVNYNQLAIEQTPSPNFYDGLADLKGVHTLVSSVLTPSINTRGFSSLSNTRMVQLIDGVNNAPPGLGFSLGNFLGLPDLDVNSVEIIPGASSALYGPNAFNGTILINSKDPFLNPGVSLQLKGGLMSSENTFNDIMLRVAQPLTQNFAFRLNLQWYSGSDWIANNIEDIDNNPINKDVRGINSPSYDGVNIYGDEVATTIDVDEVAQDLGLNLGSLGRIRVARTGYQEIFLREDRASTTKVNLGVTFLDFYKGWDINFDYRLGNGNATYQGLNRYALDDISFRQYHVLLYNNNFKLRWYRIEEDAGKSYDMRFVAWDINRAWKSDISWFQDYTSAYIQAFATGGASTDPTTAHQMARESADGGRYKPGTDEFDTAFNNSRSSTEFGNGGARFVDNSALAHLESSYSFKEIKKYINLQVGVNYRIYYLRSEGTIFNDGDDGISFTELGGYIQSVKPILNNRVKLSASLRYDKNNNFEARLTPRLATVFTLDKMRRHHVRVSYQTGFNNPDVQSQYLGLDLGVAVLMGGTEENVNSFTYNSLDLDGNPISLPGINVYNNSWTEASVNQFITSGEPNDLIQSDIDFIESERITSYEIGYRGIFGKEVFYIDINAFYNTYDNFQASTNVIVPIAGSVKDGSAIPSLVTENVRVFRLYTNSNEKVNSWGFSGEVKIDLFNNNTLLKGNYGYNKLLLDEEADNSLIPGFNTPEHRFAISIGNRNIIKNIGFNISYRWSDSYLWQSAFGNGIIDSYNVLDAQLNYYYALNKHYGMKLKLGGTNILNNDYTTAIGTPTIGSLYYLAMNIDM